MICEDCEKSDEILTEEDKELFRSMIIPINITETITKDSPLIVGNKSPYFRFKIIDPIWEIHE